MAATRVGLLPAPCAASLKAEKLPTLYAALLKRPPRVRLAC
jgi:hypothetical protein